MAPHNGSSGAAAAAIPSRSWQILGLVCLGVFMGALDGSIVNVAFPTLSAFFHVSVALVGWVTIVYLLTSTALVAIFGRLSDRLGNKPVYLSGFAVFLVGSALAGTANDVGWLIAFRALQAVGSSMLLANSVAILALEFPQQRFGTALGFIETAVSAALVVGPVAGGFLIQALGWRWIFYVNIPIALTAMILGNRLLPPTPLRASEGRFDWLGSASFGLGLGSFLLGISLGQSVGWHNPLRIGLLVAGAVLLTGFFVVERRTPNPMLDLGLFRRRSFSTANFAKVFAYATVFAVTFLIPFYLQQELGFSPAQVGLALVPMPVALAVGSLIAGPLSDRIGSGILAPVGLLVGAGGCFLFTQVSPGAGYRELFLAMVVFNLGMGCFIVPNDSIIMRSAPREKSGIASGVLAMMRSVGMIFGISFGSAVFEARLAGLVRQLGAARHAVAFVLSFHHVFLWATIVCLCGLGLTLVPPDR